MRASLAAVLLIAVSASVALSGEQPEERMKAMREALEKAKTLKVTVDGELGIKIGAITFKGVLIRGEGDNARAEVKLGLGGKTQESRVISDGKATWLIEGQKASGRPIEMNVRRYIHTALERSGVLFSLRGNKEDAEDPGPKEMKIADLKHKETEKHVYKCTYRLKAPDGAEAQVELWIDTKTNLPLRRILNIEEDGVRIKSVRETYAIEVNPELKGDVFELPKTEKE